MTSKPACATIEALAGLFPACFSVHQGRRRPLKVGIHEDLITALAGAITPKEASLALAIYCANHCYLHACTKVGAVRVGLSGEEAGRITIEEATHSRARLNQQKAKWKRRQEAEAKAKAAEEAKARNAGRISLAQLRAAAQARRAAAAA
jgi:ProP effector